MLLSKTLSPDCVKFPLVAGEKVGAIDELIDRLSRCKRIQTPAVAQRDVLDRESFCSGGIGGRIAITHATSLACQDQAVAIGRTRFPIPYASFDNRPVDLIFMVVTPPDQPGLHISTLARISFLMQDPYLRKAALHAPGPQCLHDLITLADLTDNPSLARLVA
jgi:mannitol/fructose-specific phosphotransferase system IIA component (Ntr-type)